MTLMHKLLSAPAALALALLVACGGGGGGSTPPPAVAPAISTQPVNQAVLAGATATFSVAATGTAPLSYQWKKDGVAISTNGTSASYTTPATVAGDSGASFTVTVSNSAGSVTSSAATLTVTPVGASLAYTDPTTGTYQLKKNTTLSTATHLVLDLVGPASATGCGVTATFSADTTKVTWVDVPAGGTTAAFVQNGTAFTLGAAPQILKGKVTGNVLQVAASQKGFASPVALNQPLLRLALDLKSGLAAGSVTLSADNTKCQVLDGTGTLTPITVTVGTLATQ